MTKTEMINRYAAKNEWTQEKKDEFINAIETGELKWKLAESMMWNSLSPFVRRGKERTAAFNESRRIQLAIKAAK